MFIVFQIFQFFAQCSVVIVEEETVTLHRWLKPHLQLLLSDLLGHVGHVEQHVHHGENEKDWRMWYMTFDISLDNNLV